MLFGTLSTSHMSESKQAPSGGANYGLWEVVTEGGHSRFDLLPTGSEERGVLGVGSIPVGILPSCPDM